MNIRIGVDLDEVIYKWGATARWLLRWKFGVVVGESNRWNYLKEHITDQQWNWLWQTDEDGGVGRGLFRHGNSYKGSYETLKQLDEIGDIVILTHRPKAAIKDTLDWLAFHEVPASTIHVMYGGEPKSSIKPECDIYVDDKTETVIDLAENTHGKVVLWNRPWNEPDQKDLPAEIDVIDSWDQFLALVKEAAWQTHLV